MGIGDLYYRFKFMMGFIRDSFIRDAVCEYMYFMRLPNAFSS